MKLKIKYKDFVNTYPNRYKFAIFYPIFLELKNKGFDSRKIQEILGTNVGRPRLYFWSKGGVPLPFKEFFRIKREFDKNDLERLAVIVGHIFGDGGIDKNKFLHYCNTEEFLINEFQCAMEKVFNIEATTYYHTESCGITRLRYPRLFARILLCLFGEFSLGKDNKKITQQIEDMPLEWKAELLRVWYNDDGSVPDSGHYKCVAFKQKDKHLILWIQKTLKELNINSKLDKDGNRWHLRILNYLDMLKFKKRVGFSKGYRKQIRLEKIIKEVECPHWKTKVEIIKLLKRKPRTVKELAKYLNLETGTIHGHLSGWKRSKQTKRKSTPGLINMNLVRMEKNGRRAICFLNGKEYKEFCRILNLEKLFE